MAEVSTNSLNPRKIGIASLLFIIALVLAYYFYYRQSPDNTVTAHHEITNKSIAVLPFKNLSLEEGSQYFSDGVMDAITN